jgi:hypothetical protein
MRTRDRRRWIVYAHGNSYDDGAVLLTFASKQQAREEIARREKGRDHDCVLIRGYIEYETMPGTVSV